MNRVSKEEYRHANLLLPWFVTGKLTSAEKEEVEAALDVSRELREELEQQRELADIIHKDPDVLGLVAISSQEKRLDDLMTRINEIPQDAYMGFSWKNVVTSITKYFSHFNKMLFNRSMQVAFSLFVIAQVAILAVVMNRRDEYILQGGDIESKPYVKTGETALAFQFTAQTDEKAVNGFFKELNASVVEHSKDSLNYKVVLHGNKTDDEVNQLINDLEKRTDLVLFVGRSQ